MACAHQQVQTIERETYREAVAAGEVPAPGGFPAVDHAQDVIVQLPGADGFRFCAPWWYQQLRIQHAEDAAEMIMKIMRGESLVLARPAL